MIDATSVVIGILVVGPLFLISLATFVVVAIGSSKRRRH